MKLFYAILGLVLPLQALSQPSREAVLATEAAFAAQAAQVGAPAAFLANAAPGALAVMEGRYVPIAELWNQAPASQQLRWKPLFADVSQSGDLAYTTGPRTRTQPGQPATHEEFVTVWRRPEGKPWQYVLDMRVGHAAPTTTAHLGNDRPLLTPAAPLPMAAPVQVVLGVDEKFNQAALHQPIATYDHYLSAEARLYRPGQLPLVGAAMRATGPAAGRAYLFVAEGGYLAAAGDLGYVYGSLRRPSETAGGPEETGSYLRIWRREGEAGWRIALEMLNPASGSPELPAEFLTAK